MNSFNLSSYSQSLPPSFLNPDVEDFLQNPPTEAGITSFGNVRALKFNNGRIVLMDPKQRESWDVISAEKAASYRGKIGSHTVQLFPDDGTYYVHEKAPNKDYRYGAYKKCKFARAPNGELSARLVSNLSSNEYADKILSHLHTSMEALKRLERVEGVARIAHLIRASNKRGEQKLVQYQKYYDLKDLRNFLLERSDPLPIEKRIDIAFQLLRTISQMHEKGVYHHDLKPGNILVEASKKEGRSEFYDIAISDLDVCRFEKSSPAELEGTFSWFSPEKAKALMDDSSKTTIDNEKADAWATGLILHTLFYEDKPREIKSAIKIEDDQLTFKLLSKIDRVTIESDLPAASIIQKLLEPDPSKRITVIEAFEQFKDLVHNPEESAP